MKLAQTNYDNTETGCCAKLDARTWDRQELKWKDKLFLKDHIRSFMHIPLNYGSVISRDHKQVEEAEAYPEEPLWITDEVSPWGSDIYLAVDREIPGANIEKISGTFQTRVFEGPYRNLGTWVSEMKEYVKASGHECKRLLFYYATCPKCAKHYGKNEVVVLAQVE